MATGLLLGAGASCELGMPLVRDLTTELWHHITPTVLRRINQGSVQLPASVVEDLISVIERGDMSYEDVLGYLETQAHRFSKDSSGYEGMYAWLIEHVYKAMYLHHRNHVPQIISGLRYIDGIVGLAMANEPLWIFSLNYDILVESLVSLHDVPLSYGFDERSVLPRRDSARAEVIGELPIEFASAKSLGEGRLRFFEPGQRGINLIKIHGGLDIFTFHNGEDVLRVMPLLKGPIGYFASLRAVDEELRYYADGIAPLIHPTNEIAYGDEKGEMQFLRRSLLAGAFKFRGNHPQGMPVTFLPLFEGSLNYVRTLVSIGYSFNDVHIDERLQKWLEFMEDRRIIIVSPDAAVPSFLRHLAPQVDLLRTTASEYLEQYSPSPLNAEERRHKAESAVLFKALRTQLA